MFCQCVLPKIVHFNYVHFPLNLTGEFSLVTRAELCSWDILLVTGDTHHLENTG